MRHGIEAHQRRLAPRIGEKYVEQRAHLGELVELQHAGASLLHGDNQRHGGRIHLLLHANLLRHAVIFKNEVARLEAVNNAAAALLHKRRHQHFGSCHAQIRGLALRDRHGLRSLDGRQLLRPNRRQLRQHHPGKKQKPSNSQQVGNHFGEIDCAGEIPLPARALREASRSCSLVPCRGPRRAVFARWGGLVPRSLSHHIRLRASRCISPVQARKRRSSPRVDQTKPRTLLAVRVSARRPE